MLGSFCFAEFLAYYTPALINYYDQQHEYQPSVLPDELIEEIMKHVLIQRPLS